MSGSSRRTLKRENGFRPGDQQFVRELTTTSIPLSPSELIRLAYYERIGHIVQQKAPYYESEIKAAKVMIEDTQRFMSQPLEVIFGVDSLAGDYRRLELASPPIEKKKQVLEHLEGFLSTLPRSRAIRDQAGMIADELFTNGAKQVVARLSLLGKSPGSHGKVEFFVCGGNSRLVIGCRDHSGQLDLVHLLSRIHSCYNLGVAQSIRQGTAGAGIGSFMVFDSSISYYAAVEKNKMTVVCAVLALGIGQVEYIKVLKNIHLVCVE